MSPGYASEDGSLTVALTGDTMPTRRLRPFREEAYGALLELISAADVGFTNLETVVREKNEGAPSPTKGTAMTSPPHLLDDLKALGINLASTANNHSMDYGAEGLVAMLSHLQSREIVSAGAGATLSEARKPGYLDTPMGRVALLASTSFFRPADRAGEQRPDCQGRPGINPLDFSRTYTVDTEGFACLERLSRELGLTQERIRQRAHFFSPSEAPTDQATSLHFLGSRFEKGVESGSVTEINQSDAADNLRWIKEARRQADWVIYSFHCHEFGAGGRITATTDVEMEEMAEFAVDFGRAAIDAGADIVVGHGPHLTLGVEIYRGRPIFYSLGNFVLQNDTVESFPAEAYARFGLGHDATPADFLDRRTGNETRGFPAQQEYWEGVLANCRFEGNELRAVRLYPLDLGFGRRRSERGRPLLAQGPTAKRILDRVERLSRPFGTRFADTGETPFVEIELNSAEEKKKAG